MSSAFDTVRAAVSSFIGPALGLHEALRALFEENAQLRARIQRLESELQTLQELRMTVEMLETALAAQGEEGEGTEGTESTEGNDSSQPRTPLSQIEVP